MREIASPKAAAGFGRGRLHASVGDPASRTGNLARFELASALHIARNTALFQEYRLERA
jgi:hypothetical protein